jgi:two-component system, NarL family, nitrate/nitrite response regulator NarL
VSVAPTPADAPARVVVIDDHTLFRRGVIALLSHEAAFTVVGEAASAAEGVKVAMAVHPDIVLLDLNMPGIGGLQAIPALKEAAPQARIVMLTVSEEADDLVACLRAGASGYLVKNIDAEFLVAALQRVLAGQSAMSAQMTDKLVREVQGADADERPALSPREREILRLIAAGASNKEAARTLGVAESTVKIHVQHILRKLGLATRVQAAVYAAEHGLARPD